MREDKVGLILRVMLNRYQESQPGLPKLLPKTLQESVTGHTVESDDINFLLNQSINILTQTHYSWIKPIIKELPENIQEMFLAALPNELASKLSDSLNLSLPSLKIKDSLKPFFLNKLMQNIQFDDVLPIEYILPSDMLEVAKLRKKEILNLIDYLGLFDLAEEMHNIVDKKILEKIYKCITGKKHDFLRECLQKKEKLISQRLHLEAWDGNDQKLIKLLHHRGIVRLGYALSGEKKEIVWYITHSLDTGRGEKLSRYISKEAIVGITPTLKKQVNKILNLLKKSGK